MKKPNLIQKFERWKASRVELLRQVDALRKEGEQLRKENERLRIKLSALQNAKDQAEKHAEDRRREKEALRQRLGSHKKESESNEILVEKLGAKITELRAEIDRLSRKKKKLSGKG